MLNGRQGSGLAGKNLVEPRLFPGRAYLVAAATTQARRKAPSMGSIQVKEECGGYGRKTAIQSISAIGDLLDFTALQ